MAAVEEQLIAMQLKETVDKHLNTQDARSTAENVFIDLMESLRTFAGKMPAVAHAETAKVLDEIEQKKEVFVEFVFMNFKRSLVAALKVLEGYVSLENLLVEIKTNPGRKQMWNICIMNDALEEAKKLEIAAKVEIADTAVNTFAELDTYAKIYATQNLGDVLADDPDYQVIMDQLIARWAKQDALAATFAGMFFGGDE